MLDKPPREIVEGESLHGMMFSAPSFCPKLIVSWRALSSALRLSKFRRLARIGSFEGQSSYWGGDSNESGVSVGIQKT